MTTYDALIFDCDGTLADTMPLHYRAWSLAADKFGFHFSEDRFYSLGGVPVHIIVEMLVTEAGIATMVHEVVAYKEAAYLRCLDRVVPVEPVLAIAREHRGRLPMAVASGSTREMVERTLQQLGILDWFECLVAAEDTERHKPEPDVFLEAARRLQVVPDRCCVYEDTDTGLTAARQAGMACVDIRKMHTPERQTRPK
jgi:beta-phosphoglucomutase family hydrolase